MKDYVYLFVGVAVGLALMVLLESESKAYHCHTKNFHLYESIENNGNVFLKTEKMCIDIRDIKERKSK